MPSGTTVVPKAFIFYVSINIFVTVYCLSIFEVTQGITNLYRLSIIYLLKWKGFLTFKNVKTVRFLKEEKKVLNENVTFVP